MRKLKILCLLATLWLMVGGCNNRNKDGCIRDARIDCGTLRLAIKTVNGNPYTPCDGFSTNCAVYNEDWTYANRGCGDSRDSWENNAASSPNFSIMYIPPTEMASGADVTKIFYLKANNDIDTLKITYRLRNVCFDLDKFEAYFNGILVTGDLPTSPRAIKK